MIVFNEQCIYQVWLDESDRQRVGSVEYDDAMQSIWTWCEETFGYEDDTWYHMYTEFNDCDMFAFRYEEHRNWFIMRWS